MPLATCDNCSHSCRLRECSLGFQPSPGELLCPAYAMTESFRSEIIEAVRTDFQREVAIALAYYKAERAKMFAG